MALFTGLFFKSLTSTLEVLHGLIDRFCISGGGGLETPMLVQNRKVGSSARDEWNKPGSHTHSFRSGFSGILSLLLTSRVTLQLSQSQTRSRVVLSGSQRHKDGCSGPAKGTGT